MNDDELGKRYLEQVSDDSRDDGGGKSWYVTYRFTSSEFDNYNTILRPDGCVQVKRRSVLKNIGIDTSHNQKETVGEITKMWVESDGSLVYLMGEVKYSDNGYITDKNGKRIMSSKEAYETGVIKGVSVDFHPLNTTKDEYGRKIYNEWSLTRLAVLTTLTADIPGQMDSGETSSEYRNLKTDSRKNMDSSINNESQKNDVTEIESKQKSENNNNLTPDNIRFKNTNIKSNIMQKNQNKRCLCDLEYIYVDSYLYNSETKELFIVTESSIESSGIGVEAKTKGLKMKNLITSEVIESTLEDLKLNEMYDKIDLSNVIEIVFDIMGRNNIRTLENDGTVKVNETGSQTDVKPDSYTPELQTLIRACTSCAEKAAERMAQAKAMMDKVNKREADGLAGVNTNATGTDANTISDIDNSNNTEVDSSSNTQNDEGKKDANIVDEIVKEINESDDLDRSKKEEDEKLNRDMAMGEIESKILAFEISHQTLMDRVETLEKALMEVMEKSDKTTPVNVIDEDEVTRIFKSSIQKFVSENETKRILETKQKQVNRSKEDEEVNKQIANIFKYSK